MKDQKQKPTQKSTQNQKAVTETVTTKKDLRNMSMEELVKLAKEKNLPVKLDTNKESLIKSLEILTK